MVSLFSVLFYCCVYLLSQNTIAKKSPMQSLLRPLSLILLLFETQLLFSKLNQNLDINHKCIKMVSKCHKNLEFYENSNSF